MEKNTKNELNSEVRVQKRNTIQKKLVLEAVFELANHPTAEEIYNQIVKTHKSISKGTVYRNLNILVEENQLGKVVVMDGADRFDHNNTEHNHIRCEKCNEYYDILDNAQESVDNIMNISKELSEKQGFIVSGYEVVFKGICPLCRNI